MFDQLDVFFSNRVERLFEALKAALLGGTKPFTKRLIIVPSPSMKSWLMRRLAKEMGVAMGVTITNLSLGVDWLAQQRTIKKTKRIPTLLELTLAIQDKVMLALQQESGPLWDPLRAYLDGNEFKKAKRLTALSRQLAAFFLKYGVYFPNWHEKTQPDWQTTLWHQIFSEESPWEYQERFFIDPATSFEEQDVHVHLFSISHVPRSILTFLEQVSKAYPVNLWLLSPCRMFWSDIRSDHETRQLLRYHERTNPSEEQRIQLEEALLDRHPLLANFGRVGREMMRQVEEIVPQFKEEYEVSKAVLHYPQYEEYVDESLHFGEKETFSLLEALQADLVLFKHEEKIIELQEKIPSIQVHQASSRWREVQVVHDILMQLLSENPQLEPSDVVVMAPDILVYAPFVKQVFEFQEGVLNYQIMDLNIATHSSLVKGFLLLLSLRRDRWSPATLFSLLSNPSFQKSQRLEEKEVDQFNRWVNAVGVTWGYNREHREGVLTNEQRSDSSLDANGGVTWEEAFERLILGLVTHDINEVAISFTEANTLSKFIDLFQNLYHDVGRFRDSHQMTVHEWACCLNDLLKTYFYEEQSEFDQLQSVIMEIKNASKHSFEECLSFSYVYPHLLSLLQKKEYYFRESCGNAVRFCSFLPMRTVPAKIVVLMGMHEEAFPRLDKKLSFDRYDRTASFGFCPTQSESDRYLFLEAFLSARQFLILTYNNVSSKDNKEQNPSLVITELFDCLDHSYRLNGKMPSEVCFFKHPFHAHDPVNFSQQDKPCSYSMSQFKLAKSLLSKAKGRKEPTVSSSSFPLTFEETTNITLDIKKVQSALKHPIKTYLNRHMGIYFKEQATEACQGEDPLELSPLTRYKLLQEALKNPIDKVVAKACQRGILPPSLLKESALENFTKELNEIKANIGSSPLFSLYFHPHCDAPRCENGNWVLPPISLSTERGIKVKLVGELPLVSQQGLIHYGKGNLVECAKAWPAFLLFSCVDPKVIGIESQDLRFTKQSTSRPALNIDPLHALSSCLDWSIMTEKCLTPLMPAWLSGFLERDPKALQDQIEKSLQPSQAGFLDEYLRWSFEGRLISNCEELIGVWGEFSWKLFGEMYSGWFSK